MSHILDRLNFFKKTKSSFADGHGSITLNQNQGLDIPRNGKTRINIMVDGF